jgi:hypothetical protein
MKFDNLIVDLINLLEKSSEDHWASYFKNVLQLYRSGKTSKAYKITLQAYGGMCSFNDLTLNFISDEEVQRVEAIRSYLYTFCKSKKRDPFGIFGFST